MSLARTIIGRLRVDIAAIALVVGLAGTAAGEQFEDGIEALRRGDTATAARLLGPLAESGNTSAQLALGVGPTVKGYRPAPDSAVSISAGQLEFILIAIILTVMGVVYAVKMHQLRQRRARFSELVRTLPPEIVAEAEHARQLAEERPWEPIAFRLGSIVTTERGVRLHASGDHLGQAFGFALALTMHHGPVAICEWSGDGAAGEGLIDILAHYADVRRDDGRFKELVKTSAIILQVEPPNVSFAQVVRLRCKVFFELTEGNPEIYLDLDLAEKTGSITEKDPMYRESLARAFQTSRQETTASS